MASHYTLNLEQNPNSLLWQWRDGSSRFGPLPSLWPDSMQYSLLIVVHMFSPSSVPASFLSCPLYLLQLSLGAAPSPCSVISGRPLWAVPSRFAASLPYDLQYCSVPSEHQSQFMLPTLSISTLKLLKAETMFLLLTNVWSGYSKYPIKCFVELNKKCGWLNSELKSSPNVKGLFFYVTFFIVFWIYWLYVCVHNC